MSRRHRESASQTAGPFVHIGLLPGAAGLDSPFAVATAGPRLGVEGRPRIVIEGCVYDGAGEPLRDLLVEAWLPDLQAPAWARAAADAASGLFRFEASLPDCGPQAPHVCLLLLARGINQGLHTRLYFEDQAEANARDPVLLAIADPVRRARLIARRLSGGPARYHFDIRLQGEGETVFFDV
ncbi:protocatechuate 3,4-dioxygenase subunit alpha [Pelomonas sp. SE-A7]|uniref:protocatechuate 3,4-dioxygenase subunit alpha n=1 Tax=Pelomonas sp. SE-A7 TaxID=3054953 RepID=UPI00259CAE4B|nr:protocatechuate 3,4-dioxygenase subunit alpha [Pelomonas sp. SE-A7]MDM4768535.1 protocatechuate 3,4-dioxygenase subunit alpha [Pelomonas sp. SE-A7]